MLDRPEASPVLPDPYEAYRNKGGKLACETVNKLMAALDQFIWQSEKVDEEDMVSVERARLQAEIYAGCKKVTITDEQKWAYAQLRLSKVAAFSNDPEDGNPRLWSDHLIFEEALLLPTLAQWNSAKVSLSLSSAA